MIKTVYLLFLLAFIKSFSALTQIEAHSQRKVSKEQASDDFRVLFETLKSYHPALFQFTSENEMNTHFEQLLQSIQDSISDADFHILVRHFVEKIRCGHTVAFPSEQQYSEYQKQYLRLPFYVYFLEDKLFVEKLYIDSTEELIGAEIISINGRNASDIIRDMKAIQHRDGIHETFIIKQIENNFRMYYMFLYGQDSTYDVEFKRNGQYLIEKKQLIAQAELSEVVPVNSKSSLLDHKEDFSFISLSGFQNNKEWAFLSINSFDYRKFKKSYKEVFKRIENDNVNHLVIDLRYNGGGYFPNANYLLRYLIPEKFTFNFYRSKEKIENKTLKISFWNKLSKSLFVFFPDKLKKSGVRTYSFIYKPKKQYFYEGNVYVLTSGKTFSMASVVSTYLKQSTTAMFIGQETGGGANGSNGILFNILTLPYSKVRINIPFYHVYHSFSSEFGCGVKPDVEIRYTIEDLIQGKDKEIEYMETLIK